APAHRRLPPPALGHGQPALHRGGVPDRGVGARLHLELPGLDPAGPARRGRPVGGQQPGVGDQLPAALAQLPPPARHPLRGPGFAGLILIQEQRHRGGTGEPRAAALRRLAGTPPPDPPGPKDLEADDLGVLPLPTIWPLAAALGFTILFTGLIYGLWLVILGL